MPWRLPAVFWNVTPCGMVNISNTLLRCTEDGGHGRFLQTVGNMLPHYTHVITSQKTVNFLTVAMVRMVQDTWGWVTNHYVSVNEPSSQSSRAQMRVLLRWCDSDIPHSLPGFIQQLMYWVHSGVVRGNGIARVHRNAMLLKHSSSPEFEARH